MQHGHPIRDLLSILVTTVLPLTCMAAFTARPADMTMCATGYPNHCSRVWLFFSIAFFRRFSDAATLSGENSLSPTR